MEGVDDIPSRSNPKSRNRRDQKMKRLIVDFLRPMSLTRSVPTSRYEGVGYVSNGLLHLQDKGGAWSFSVSLGAVASITYPDKDGPVGGRRT